ncbi:Host cell surface-exposed lipoprotein [Popillia japonica]|uniref:Host cell surface-exposed lipoprotein n=1 Tax=Popillia japonica TaxID=7064 RepID=A0AAW1HUZ0_POPJA
MEKENNKMKCPKCENELRESSKYPGYGMCDFCKKKYKLLNEDEYEEAAEFTASPKKRKGGKLKWVIVAVVAVIIIGAIGNGMGGDKDASTNTKAENEETAANNVETSESEPVSQTDGATLGQSNALSKAKEYLSVMAFSYTGLIGQLEFDDFSSEDATYGADNCGADWNEQAAKKAQEYIDTMSFSRQGLIDQLVFDGFTQEQAEHGATAIGY